MQRHKWNQQDYALLEENVREYGLTLGSKKTAEKLHLTQKACKSMYEYRLHKFKESGIKIDHPEVVKKAKIVKNETQKKPRWTEEELFLLKKNVEKYGICQGLERTSISTGRSKNACNCKFYSFAKKEELIYNGKRNFTSKEQEIKIAERLKEKIEANPNNLTNAFKDVAKEFGFKSYNTIANRWYGIKSKHCDYSKKPSCRHNIGEVFTVLGTNATINGKNQAKPDVRKTNWLLAIFKKWNNKRKK